MTVTDIADETDFDIRANLDLIRGWVAGGRLAEAAALCETASAQPGQTSGVVPLLALIRLMQGDISTALSVLRSADYLYGTAFGQLLTKAEDILATGAVADAAALVRQAIAMEPFRKEAASLFKAGRRADAQAVMRAGHRTSFWYRGQKAGHADGRLRVAVFYALGGGSTPTRFTIDHTRFDVETICMVPDFDYPIDQFNRCFDIVFNAASDPDWDQTAVDIAADLAARLSIPVVNAPNAMQATMRHLTPDRLKDIPGLYVPQTRRFFRETLLAQADALLAGMAFPVLLRPAGSHGGNGLVRVDDVAGLMREAVAMDCDHVYVTEYHDFASADGLYRKLRVVFVDGQVFPYHLSISDHWLNHYYRTRTAEEAALQAEEGVFLRDPAAYLGPAAFGAVQAIATRHPLGFFGVDGAIDRDGRLVLFECNATMLVKTDPQPGKTDYKQGAAEAIRAAMSALLLRTAGVSDIGANNGTANSA